MQQEKFDQLIAHLEQQTKVSEFDFASSVPIVGPLVAAFRRGWNNVSTRWVMQHYAKQQLEFQHTLIGLLHEMQHTQTLMEQKFDEIHTRFVNLERINTRNQTLHETFNRDLEMLALHSLRQNANTPPE